MMSGRVCACALALVSGGVAALASADVALVVDHYASDGYFTGLMVIPGAPSADVRDTLRTGTMPGLTGTRSVAMGLAGDPLSDISGIAAGSVDSGTLNFGASITLSGSGQQRYVFASVSASYLADSTIDLSQAVSANLDLTGSATGDLVFASLVLVDASFNLRTYDILLANGTIPNLAFDLTGAPASSEPGFDVSSVRRVQWTLETEMDFFRGNGTGDISVNVDTFSVTFVPGPAAGTLAAMGLPVLARRRRR